jgi:RNA polymerase sigma factor (sigma-70 family)
MMKDIQDDTVGYMIEMIAPLRSYALSLTKNSADADDLVQETLTKAIARVDSFTPGTSLRAWLFTIMRNTFLNSLRKWQREPTGTKDCVSDTAVDIPRQELHVLGQELISIINALPVRYRETLVLVVVLGESYEEAARICGCAVGTVKSRVNRGRNMVMAALA